MPPPLARTDAPELDDTVDAEHPSPARQAVFALRTRLPVGLVGLVIGRRRALVAVGVALALATFAGLVALRSLPRPGPPELELPFTVGAAPRAGATTAARAAAPDVGTVTDTAPTTSAGGSGALLVHVAGAVVHPGVYRLAEGARVIDAALAAGGTTLAADLARVNLAARLADGERVYVPRSGEEVPATPGGGTVGGAVPGTRPGPVNLNQATAEQLDALPGVGPTTAANILAHRRDRGAFRSVDDLLSVAGIGPAKLEQLRPLVTV